MAKLESTFRNMLVALFGVTLIASASLGLVYNVTKSPIERAELEKQNNAIAAVLPQFEELGTAYKKFPPEGRDSVDIFPALDQNGEIVAHAVKSYTYSGFSGYIEIMVGIDVNNTITGFRVLRHAETPGLGSKMEQWHNDTEKPGQNIVGRTLNEEGLKVSKDGGDVDAITAATITSRALMDALNRANATVSDLDSYTGATPVNN